MPELNRFYGIIIRFYYRDHPPTHFSFVTRIPRGRMKPQKRYSAMAMGGILTAGLVHSVLPAGDIWLRALFTSASCAAASSLLAFALPKSPPP